MFLLLSSLLLSLLSSAPGAQTALPASPCAAGQDTAQLGEAVVTASPKVNMALRSQPTAGTRLERAGLRAADVRSTRDLSLLAPGFFMPHYGSRLTSAIYVRGVGSRQGSSAVGFYVDNVPCLDKTAFSQSLLEAESVELLRGPQGTLYGQGAMAGLVRIETPSPLRVQGWTLRLGASAPGAGRELSASGALHFSPRLALGLSAFYTGQEGVRRAAPELPGTRGRRAERDNGGGLRSRLAWQASERTEVGLTFQMERSAEQACPYFLTDAGGDEQLAAQLGTISAGSTPTYRRTLLTAALTASHRLNRTTLTSVSSVQHVADRFWADQDFTAPDIFHMEQRQRLTSFTQEVMLKSLASHRWQWSLGLLGTGQRMRTTCPVVFGADGVDWLNAQMQRVLPKSLPMELALTQSELPLTSSLHTPAATLAAYWQQTLRDLFVPGLSLTAGLRAEYALHRLHLRSGAADAGAGPDVVAYHLALPQMRVDLPLAADMRSEATLRRDGWQLLPKVALMWEFRHCQAVRAAGGTLSGQGTGVKGNVYFSVSKGARPGGYNVQSYSQMSQTQLQRAMMLGTQQASAQTLAALPLPPAVRDKALQGMNAAIEAHLPLPAEAASLYYRPEQTWSHELGGHLDLARAQTTLQLDAALYVMRTRDQQLSSFARSGLGREVVNAGSTLSRGAELSARLLALRERLSLQGGWGYCYATFRTGERRHQRVPYAPRHTLSAALAWKQPLPGPDSRPLRSVTLGLDLRSSGPTVWDFGQSVRQDAAALPSARPGHQGLRSELGAHLALALRGGSTLTLWGRNLSGTRQATFAFESMGHRFEQLAQPRCFGLTCLLHFS